jgi:hypothetical protein
MRSPCTTSDNCSKEGPDSAGLLRFSTWQRKQRICGFDGQAHDVDEVQLAFKASAVLRRRLKEKSSKGTGRQQQQVAESTLRDRELKPCLRLAP